VPWCACIHLNRIKSPCDFVCIDCHKDLRSPSNHTGRSRFLFSVPLYPFVVDQASMSFPPNVRRRSMPKAVRYGLLRYILYTYFTHAQTCDNTRVQRATAWTASVHFVHMPKPVMTYVFTVPWGSHIEKKQIPVLKNSSSILLRLVWLRGFKILIAWSILILVWYWLWYWSGIELGLVWYDLLLIYPKVGIPFAQRAGWSCVMWN